MQDPLPAEHAFLQVAELLAEPSNFLALLLEEPAGLVLCKQVESEPRREGDRVRPRRVHGDRDARVLFAVHERP